ncbi:MAG: hypothetical protein NDJ90_15865 [Oligoflexia bacterium]|nr:hypothetical protein [Oligoflexia bacterium]
MSRLRFCLVVLSATLLPLSAWSASTPPDAETPAWPPSELDRSPAVLGPPTDEPSERPELYLDYAETISDSVPVTYVDTIPADDVL